MQRGGEVLKKRRCRGWGGEMKNIWGCRTVGKEEEEKRNGSKVGA